MSSGRDPKGKRTPHPSVSYFKTTVLVSLRSERDSTGPGDPGGTSRVHPFPRLTSRFGSAVTPSNR